MDVLYDAFMRASYHCQWGKTVSTERSCLFVWRFQCRRITRGGAPFTPALWSFRVPERSERFVLTRCVTAAFMIRMKNIAPARDKLFSSIGWSMLCLAWDTDTFALVFRGLFTLSYFYKSTLQHSVIVTYAPQI